jgi:6-pyruvoyltetrahydropterin/6-carboxytetrahydropterin synthase
MAFKFTIDKEFHFEMGHRVWAQKLNRPDLSIETECACKHLHGHSYAIKVFLGADTLDQSAMVTDFKNLNFMKEFVDNVLDHKFMIDINDPNFEIITSVSPKFTDNIVVKNFMNLGEVFVARLPGTSTADADRQLHLNSFVLVDFVPTSENICKYLKQYAQERIGDFATVTAVELWETKKSHCRYED